MQVFSSIAGPVAACRHTSCLESQTFNLQLKSLAMPYAYM